MEIFTLAGLAVFGQVIMIDLILSGDNAVVIGLAASGLPPVQRRKAIIIGIAAATVLRIFLAVIAVYLLGIKGILLIGGLVLLWICWRMFQDLNGQGHAEHEIGADGEAVAGKPKKTLGKAVTQIVIADVSMALDNVLAVAGAARDHLELLVFGLLLSVVLMGVAASWIAKLIEKYRWIGYVGLAILVYVSLRMIFEGTHQLLELMPA